MGIITLPNFRTTADVTAMVRLKDGGLAIDWSGLTGIKAWLYSDAQKAISGRFDVSVNQEDNTLLKCDYSATKPQYLGVNRIIIQAKYHGRVKTYDKALLNFVSRTSDVPGDITIEDPIVDLEIEVSDVSSSILDEVIYSAIAATEKANEAAEQIPLQVLTDAREAAAEATAAAEAANAAGIDDVEADADNNVGTPSVDATLENKKLTLHFHNIKGLTGNTPHITIGTISTLPEGSQATVTLRGTADDPIMDIGIPVGATGLQGNPGSSIDYPFELVNNEETDDPEKAHTAAGAKRLKQEIHELGQDVTDKYGDYIETADFIRVVVDKDNRLLYGVKEDGEFVFGKGVPAQVRQFVLNEISGKVDKEEGKVLSSNDYTDGDKEKVNVQELLDNPIWAKVTVDKDYKVLEGIKKSGERVENIPVQFPAATIQSEPNELWSYVLTDDSDRVIAGVKRSGTAFIGKLEVEQFESPVIEELEKKEEYYHGIYPHNSIVSFIDDDTGIYTPEIWGEIIAETGIRMGFACIAGIMSGEFSDYSPIYAPMSLADLQALYDAGHEVYSHSWSHPAFYADNVTLDMIQEQCQKSRDWLNKNGFTRNSDIIVYPGGLGPTRTAKLAVVRRNYRYGVDTVFNDGTNPDGVNPEPLFNDLSIYRCNGDTMTLAELKATFDVAQQENKLLVIMNHSYELNKDKENQIAKIVSFIRYIQSTDASILPLEEALHQMYGWH